MTPLDLHASVLLLTVVAAVAGSYAVRLAVAGPAHFPRVDAAGASPFLGRSAMEMAYWSLQPLGNACVSMGLTANGITRASLALGAAAGVALALGHLGVAAALATAASLGDALDGMVARTTRTASRSGAILDAAADRYQEFFFLGGLALHYHDSAVKLAVTLLALVGSFMVSYGSAKAEALGVAAPRGAMRRAERAAYLCGGALLSPLAWAATDAGALGPSSPRGSPRRRCSPRSRSWAWSPTSPPCAASAVARAAGAPGRGAAVGSEARPAQHAGLVPPAPAQAPSKPPAPELAPR